MDGTAHGLLESVTQKTLYAQNFNRASSQASHALTDLLSRYVSLLATTCARYAEHAERTSVSMPDAIFALDELGVSIDELVDYAEGEGRQMQMERYSAVTSRRAEELALLKDMLNEGRRVEQDDAIALVYGEVPEHGLNGHSAIDDEYDSEASDDESSDAKPRVNGDVNGSEKGDIRLASPALPPSPISNPGSPLRKRPRLANWNPPSHIPDFLPPYPATANGNISQPPSPQVKSESDMTHPPHPSPSERERDRLPTPLPQQLSTAASAADYLTPVPYNMSSLSSAAEVHLPDRQSFKKALSGPVQALQLQERKHPTPEIAPALVGAYHHMLTNPPPPHPSTNPARHRVALAMLGQAYAVPRWTPADTLFANGAAPRPRVVAPAPTFPVPIGGKKDDPPLFMPSYTSRPVVTNESVVIPSCQPRSRIPDIARAILPVPVFNRATRVNPPPPLINSATKEKLLYGPGVPAPWNSSPSGQGPNAGATQSGKNKGKDEKGDGEEDDRRKDQNERDVDVLPDAMMVATWDWEVHDFRMPPSHHKRGRPLGSFSLNAMAQNGLIGIDGAVQSAGPPRKNSIKIGKGK